MNNHCNEADFHTGDDIYVNSGAVLTSHQSTDDVTGTADDGDEVEYTNFEEVQNQYATHPQTNGGDDDDDEQDMYMNVDSSVVRQRQQFPRP